MIVAPTNISSLPEDTKELVKEMYFSIMNKDYPSYNAAMSLYRPILIHILKDHQIQEDYRTMNYTEAIKLIRKYWSIDQKFVDRMFVMKDFVNHINHDCKVVLDKDYEMVIESWKIVKELVEEIY